MMLNTLFVLSARVCAGAGANAAAQLHNRGLVIAVHRNWRHPIGEERCSTPACISSQVSQSTAVHTSTRLVHCYIYTPSAICIFGRHMR
jgi:hypothetical protein